MSDKIENNVEEKSAEEQVLETPTSKVEEKTAGFVSEEKAAEMVAEATKAVEEKSVESMEELKTQFNALSEKLLDLEAQKAAPAVIGGNSQMEIKFAETALETGGVAQAQKFDVVTKRFGGNTDVPGGRVDTNAPYYLLQQANVYRELGTVLPASGGAVKLPAVNSISWASESAQPASARTPGGGLVNKNVLIETWVSELSLIHI